MAADVTAARSAAADLAAKLSTRRQCYPVAP